MHQLFKYISVIIIFIFIKDGILLYANWSTPNQL